MDPQGSMGCTDFLGTAHKTHGEGRERSFIIQWESHGLSQPKRLTTARVKSCWNLDPKEACGANYKQC